MPEKLALSTLCCGNTTAIRTTSMGVATASTECTTLRSNTSWRAGSSATDTIGRRNCAGSMCCTSWLREEGDRRRECRREFV